MNMRLLAAVVILAVATGCLPLTHMNAAPTVKPGHVELGAGLNTLTGDGSGTAPNLGFRVGIVPRMDLGMVLDSLSRNVDIKIHLITDEMAGFDLAASLGVGASVLAVYKYWNVVVSKDTGSFTPYFAFRNVYTDYENDAGDDPEPFEDIFISLITAGVNDLNQFFIGTEYAISNRTFFVVEAMYLYALDAEKLFAVNAGLKFRF